MPNGKSRILAGLAATALMATTGTPAAAALEDVWGVVAQVDPSVQTPANAGNPADNQANGPDGDDATDDTY